METEVVPQPPRRPPRRITDLVKARSAGADVRLEIAFEILPADLHHRLVPYQAYLFLGRFSGAIDGRAFAFRKCYARGCPNNLCTHVSLAVNIANRYLQRDYHKLKSAGIRVAETLFALNDMIVQFDTLEETGVRTLTIPDLVGVARSGQAVAVRVHLELIPAVAYFEVVKDAQTFFSGEFNAESGDTRYYCQRCLACYATDREAEEKAIAVSVANARLEQIYYQFKQSDIQFQACYFD